MDRSVDYILQAVRVERRQVCSAHLVRWTDRVTSRSSGALTQRQQRAYATALALVRRDDPGDRRHAVRVLRAVGFEVMTIT